jgi:hypothetical protein
VPRRLGHTVYTWAVIFSTTSFAFSGEIIPPCGAGKLKNFSSLGKRGMTWKWVCGTICPASVPEFETMLTPEHLKQSESHKEKVSGRAMGGVPRERLRVRNWRRPLGTRSDTACSKQTRAGAHMNDKTQNGSPSLWSPVHSSKCVRTG